MNIVVCLKQVPGTTEVRIDPETNTLIRQDIESVVNPFDSYALEEGVRLKEQNGGNVIAISMGPPQAEAVLREAVSVGADEATLVSDNVFAGSDTWATAYTLAKAIEKLKQYDLIICGRQTIDGDTGQVGPELSEILSLPFIAYVSEIQEIDNKHIRVRRMVEEGYEIIEASLPAVITVVKEINIPRLPSLRGLAKSRSITIPIWTASELSIDKTLVGLSGSATRVVKIFFPNRASHSEMFQGDVDSQVDALVAKLKEIKVA